MTPQEIKEARLSAGLTQKQAAGIVFCSLRAWQNWEAGAQKMPPAEAELFLIKTRAYCVGRTEKPL